MSFIVIPLLLGCDGGTIARRSEIVKTKEQKDKKEQESVDKEANLAAKWQMCALSGLKLQHPIVACGLGRLYNKDLILEHLLNQRDNHRVNLMAASSTTSEKFNKEIIPHIKSLKDVKTLKFKFDDSSDLNSNSGTDNLDDDFKLTKFVCPISGLEMNGRYKFCFLYTCGCVLSERAMREVSSRVCLICSTPFDPELDVVTINPTLPEDLEENRTKMNRRREILMSNKRKSKLEKPVAKMHKSCTEGQMASSKDLPVVESRTQKL